MDDIISGGKNMEVIYDEIASEYPLVSDKVFKRVMAALNKRIKAGGGKMTMFSTTNGNNPFFTTKTIRKGKI